LYALLSFQLFVQGEHNNHGISNPSQAAKTIETTVRRQPAAQRMPAHVVAHHGNESIIIIIAITTFLAIAAMIVISDFAFEVMFSTDPALGVRLFTNKFNRFVGPRLQHSLEIGRLNMEFSFKFHSDSTSAHHYANVAVGARSIPGLTSPLYSPPLHLDITRLDKTFWKSFSPRPTIHPPEVALSGGNNPGQCWAFAGYSGQLGIQLLAPVQVMSFIIEHTWEKSFAESAPRNVVLWGLIPTDGLGSESPMRNISSSPLHPQFGTSHVGIQLASVVFDAIQGQPRQTFLLHRTKTGQHFDRLVAQILGNWGHPDYTCLYRLEIHGSEWPV
jgi:hypothetical protein